MLAFESIRGITGVILVAIAAIFLGGLAACTTKTANVQQPILAEPDVQTEQAVELLSPLELLKAGSTTPGRFNTGEKSSSVISSRVYGRTYKPFDQLGKGELRHTAFAGYRFDLSGFNGPYDLMTQWTGGFGDYNELWVGLSDWENNSWSWFLTDEGSLDSETVQQHISAGFDLLVVLAVGGMDQRTLDWLRVGPDFLPTANITTSASFGLSPMTVKLNASGSEDLEGGLEYAWDETGDGEFTDFGPSGTHDIVLLETQVLRSSVKVRDSANHTDEAELEQFIEVLGSQTMSLESDWETNHPYSYKGLGSLEAPFFLEEDVEGENRSFTVTDKPDGGGNPIDPESLHWTLQWVSTEFRVSGYPEYGVDYRRGFGVGEARYSWSNPGELLIGERGGLIGAIAYDDDYNTTGTIYFLGRSQPGYEMVICFDPSQTTGDYPLLVDFHHTMSYVTDYDSWEHPDIVAWDFESDGVIDHGTPYQLGDFGLDGASFVFQEPGIYTVTASPIWEYDEPPYQKSFSQVITVTDGGGPKWHFNKIPMPHNLASDELAGWGWLDLIELQGKPAVRAITEADDFEDRQNFIVRALDSLGTTWENDGTVIENYATNLTVIGGKPAILAWGNYPLSFVHALDAAGNTWDTPVTIYEGEFSPNYFELEKINGSPGVVIKIGNYPDYELVFVGYDGVTAPNGWFSETLDSCYDPNGSQSYSLVEVYGQPAVAYSYRNHASGKDEVRFILAQDGVGKSWGAPITVNTRDQRWSGINPSLTVVNGLPVICHLSNIGYANTMLNFSMAGAPDGSQWIPALEIGEVIPGNSRYESWIYESLNKPLILTREIASHGADVIRMWTAEDGEGTYWNEASGVFASRFNSVDTAIIDGKPAVVMVTDNRNFETETRYELQFGMLY